MRGSPSGCAGGERRARNVRHASAFKPPILIFADTDDTGVPIGPALELARARPDLVTLVQTSGGGHVGSWNVNPAAYEKASEEFVTRPWTPAPSRCCTRPECPWCSPA
ncbi:alpha/beta hydrolase family protein [Nonomuraea sp. NPDC059194]|uniref:alpha/beta hydrolase family protein n=1 Tax=Nonomuraea sp. NPDC059194 TaxID=3346764 RepID=UPI00368A7940